MKTFCLFIILLFLFVGELNATRYYVDNVNGNDLTNSGTHPDTAWKTISKVNIFSFQPGDIISFKCGQIFQGTTLIPQNSGSEGLPITFNSYGIGDSPVIDRNGDNPAYWRAEDTGDSLSAFDTTGTGGSCVFLDSKDHITFSGIKFVRGFNTNVTIWNSNYLTIESCNIESAWQTHYETGSPGMIYIGGDSANPPHHITIRNSTIMYSRYGHGIYINPAHQLLMEYDDICCNGSNGLQTVSAYISTPSLADVCFQDTIRYCKIRYNDKVHQGDFQIFDNSCQNSAFYYNIIEADTSDSANCTAIRIQNNYNTPPHNVLWANNTIIMHGTGDAFDWGDTLTMGIDNITVKNNIIYLDKTTQYGMYFYGSVGSHNVITNNLYYYPAGGTHLFHSGPDNHIYDYPDISTWKSASNNFTTPAGGFEAGSVTDPDNSTFINTDLTNLQLKNGSNAILAGINVNLTQDIVGKTVGNPPDIGAFQNASYLSGTLSTSKTMSGNVAITGNLTLSSGSTLNISNNTSIKVVNGSSIYIHGTLNADIVTFQPLGSSNWGWLAFDGADACQSHINYC